MEFENKNKKAAKASSTNRTQGSDPDALLKETEAARMLNLTTRALQAWRCRGGGPKFIRISRRCIRYRRADLLQWIDERECASTSAPIKGVV